MSHTPHELADDFPEHRDRIAALKASDAHFARLVEEYHAVNRAVHRAETLSEPTTHEHETELRRLRARLKDAIWRRLAVPE
jgi:uncharacterized protein YdcH (DUF465 family)